MLKLQDHNFTFDFGRDQLTFMKPIYNTNINIETENVVPDLSFTNLLTSLGK